MSHAKPNVNLNVSLNAPGSRVFEFERLSRIFGETSRIIRAGWTYDILDSLVSLTFNATPPRRFPHLRHFIEVTHERDYVEHPVHAWPRRRRKQLWMVLYEISGVTRGARRCATQGRATSPCREIARQSLLFLFAFLPPIVVCRPLCRCVAGMWIPILSSVSLTNESSASVRSSKGKLQLGEISPIERTQRERRRIVTVTTNFAPSRDSRWHASRTIRSGRRSLSSSPLSVEEDRPAAALGRRLLLSEVRARANRPARDRSAQHADRFSTPIVWWYVCVYM